MARRIEVECARAAVRVRSMRIRDFRWALEGETVVLDGDALTPEAIDSATRVFEATAVRAVRNRMRHAPPDPLRPNALWAGHGFVDVVHLGQNAARLAETITWEVRKGDTLARIAEAVYGDAAKAPVIAQANANFVGPDGHVFPGQRLRIPPSR